MRRKLSTSKIALAACILIITVITSGCGQKGDLYIPHDESASSG